MVVGKPDFFTEHPEALKDGAKLVLSRIVRDELGFMRVPRIFHTLEEAIRSGARFIIRSNHPEEYHSLAGFFRSVIPDMENGNYVVESSDISRRELGLRSEDDLPQLLPEVAYNRSSFANYTALTGRDTSEFMKDFRFSFWEYVYGINGTMFADPVVPSKYHFFQMDGSIVYMQFNIASGKLEVAGVHPKELEDYVPAGKKTLFELIEAYEKIRNSAKFNGSHCYEMEYEITGEGNFTSCSLGV